MTDFIFAAFPWVACGISLALILTTANSKKVATTENQTTFENISIQKKDETIDETYMLTGMCYGLCFGIVIGSSLIYKFGGIALTYGICFGLLGGMLVGSYINKK